MDYYEQSFRTYLKIRAIQEGRKINMNGGVREKVRIGNHNIEYDLNIKRTGRGPKQTLDLIAIATGKANDKQPCFIMHIRPGGASSITSLSRGIACFLDKTDDSTGLVLAGLEIAKLKGAKTFEFTDNSVKVVDGYKIRLSELSLITTGKTWYERILPDIKVVDEEEREILEVSKINISNSTWHMVYRKLLNFDINAELDYSGIDINAPGSAMKVLDRAKKSKKYTEFFAKEMFYLLKSYDAFPVHGYHWIMNIS